MNSSSTKKLIVDVNPYRTTAALVDGEHLCEIHAEDTKKQKLVGDIYKGVVQSVLPGLSAAFVNIGQHKNAILHFSNIRIDDRRNGGSRFSLPPSGADISKCIKIGQEVIVQVSKEPVGTKGPKLTMSITLPAHTLVLLPGCETVCISKRFRSGFQRNRVKSLLLEHLPKDMGVIARSESELMDDDKILADFEALHSKWKEIEKKLDISPAPGLIWQDEDLISRAVRELMRSDVEELFINSNDGYDRIISLLSASTPHLVNRVKFIEDDTDLIERFNLRRQINIGLDRYVWLKSGAYLVFDKTEALTSIDVNTGKNVGDRNLQETILATNLEAVEEIARQIRLRNIGGIIVIDFIDMIPQQNRETVVAALKVAMSKDNARPVVFQMTNLGLVEMARRRTGKSLAELFTTKCPVCDGHGVTLSAQTVALRARNRLMHLIHNGNKSFCISALPSVISVLKPIIEQDILIGLIEKDIRVTYRNNFFLSPSDVEIKLN